MLKKIFGHIIITPEIADEFGDILPDWIEIFTSKDKHTKLLLEMQIDKGEASAIALALELQALFMAKE